MSVPILISFKRHLESLHSPLLGLTLTLISQYFIDFRSELEDLLAADKQLAVELKYDVRMWEQEQKEKQQQGQLQR